MRGAENMTELDLEAIKARCTGPNIRIYSSDEVQMFIAHARTDIPALIAEVERLRTALTKESDRAIKLLRRIDGYENLIQKLDWK